MFALASPVPAHRGPFLVGALLLAAAAACTRTNDTAGDTLLARDLTLASSTVAHSPVAQPVVFADTTIALREPAPAPAPVREAPPAPVVRRVADAPRATTAPAPPPTPAESPVAASTPTDSAASAAAAPGPTSAGHSVGAGATLALSMASQVCSATNRPGDRFVATLTQPLTADDGTVLLPVGSSVVVELTTATSGANEAGHVELVVRGVSIDGFYRAAAAQVADVDAQLQRQRYDVAGSSARGKVGRGAMTGAILGSIFGRSTKGAVIGAAAGAAAGAASAAGSAHYQGCLPAGAPIRARLSESLAIG